MKIVLNSDEKLAATKAIIVANDGLPGANGCNGATTSYDDKGNFVVDLNPEMVVEYIGLIVKFMKPIKALVLSIESMFEMIQPFCDSFNEKWFSTKQESTKEAA